MPKFVKAGSSSPRASTSSAAKGDSPIAAASKALPMFAAAQQLRSWGEAMLGMAGNAADMSLTLAKVKASDPKQKAAIEKAGNVLRKMRETAGMTTKELEQAIDLRDAGLLEQAESGKAALPFEVILRLAGVLGRHDPIPFTMKLTRSYNPELWNAFEAIGIGRLAVQGGRERELANVYRANDAARRLSDEEFAAVLAFVKTAFDMAVEFRSAPAKE